MKSFPPLVRRVISFSLFLMLLSASFLLSSCKGLEGREAELTTEEWTWLMAIGRPLRAGYLLDEGGVGDLRIAEKGAPTIGVEYLQEYSRMAGLEIEYIPFNSFAEILRAVRNRQIDIVADAAPSRERLDYLTFTKPYIEIPAILLTRKENVSVKGLSDIEDEKVGTIRGYAVNNFLKDEHPGITLEMFDDNLTLFLALSFGKIDYAVMDQGNATRLLSETGIINLSKVSDIPFTYQLGTAVRSDMGILAGIIGRMREKIAPETQRRINSHWIGFSQKSILQNPSFWIAALLLLIISLVLAALIIIWNRSLARRVEVKTQQMEEQLKEKEKAEENLRLDEQRLEGLLRLSQMENSSLEEMARFALDQLVSITQSRLGLLCFFSDQGKLDAMSLWPDYETARRYVKDDSRLKRASVWEYFLEPNEIILENKFSYKNHFVQEPDDRRFFLKRILLFPIYNRNKLFMVGGVGNKEKDYDLSDTRQLEMVMRGLSRLVQEKKYRLGLEADRDHLAVEVERRSQELEKTRQDLVEVNKMAALGGLVAGVAHEINNPLGVAITAGSFLEGTVQDLTQSIKAGSLTKSDMDKFLEHAEESTRSINFNLKKAAEQVRSFKQVATDQAVKETRRIRLKDYLDEIFLALKPKLKHTPHQLTTECPEELEVVIEPSALLQIITNFVANSLLHGFDGIEKGHITLVVNEEKDQVRMEYRDNGNGMPPEILEKVYEPFFTTRRGRGGTGLGMHLVKNLVEEDLQGRLTAESAPGEGVRFILLFPKVPAAASADHP